MRQSTQQKIIDLKDSMGFDRWATAKDEEEGRVAILLSDDLNDNDATAALEQMLEVLIEDA